MDATREHQRRVCPSPARETKYVRRSPSKAHRCQHAPAGAIPRQHTLGAHCKPGSANCSLKRTDNLPTTDSVRSQAEGATRAGASSVDARPTPNQHYDRRGHQSARTLQGTGKRVAAHKPRCYRYGVGIRQASRETQSPTTGDDCSFCIARGFSALAWLTWSERSNGICPVH